MTLTSTDHWTRLDPSPARNPLLDEMGEAGREALLATGTAERAFYTGLFTGYAVGFGLVTREALDRARREPSSVNLHIRFRRAAAFDDDTTWWACGVRHGYYLATSERPDADECGLCGERICVNTDDYEGCDDGVFCLLDGCKQLWHSNGPHACQDDE